LKLENRDSYNERNFENLVNYYEKELKRILQGVSVSKTLSNSERGTLLRSGARAQLGHPMGLVDVSCPLCDARAAG